LKTLGSSIPKPWNNNLTKDEDPMISNNQQRNFHDHDLLNRLFREPVFPKAKVKRKTIFRRLKLNFEKLFFQRQKKTGLG